MNRHLRLMAVCALACVLFGGCPAGEPGNTDNTDNTGNTGGTDSTGGTDNTGGTAVARTLTGTINASESAKRTALYQDTEQYYSVIVQSTESQQTYTGQTDGSGSFEVDIPEDETGETFMVTIMMPDGQPAGPVVFDQEGTDGVTGLDVSGDTSLGSIAFPDDPTQAPIVPGTDADYDPNNVNGDVVARLNDDGVPVGVPEFGRGDDAEGDASGDSNQQIDADQDGMIDLFDADDDGDGTIDDFDDDATLNPGGEGLEINFFMNLKIDDEQATPYFSGDTAGIEASLKGSTVITFEVRGTSALGKNITAARIIGPPSPAPAYLSISTIMGSAPATLWSDSSYALQPADTNHFQERVVPNDFMYTGDTFTLELTFDDGTVGVYSRMVNYVFKSIPKLINVGPPGALTTFNGPAVITFDGTQDLAFEWAPPVDDFGNLLTGLPYAFEVFYYDSSDQQISDIDGAATWPTPPTDFNADNTNYEVDGSTLTTVSANGTFTLTLPKEIFANTVQTASGPVSVASYKVDIAAQNNGNNAALMVRLEKN